MGFAHDDICKVILGLCPKPIQGAELLETHDVALRFCKSEGY